MTATAACIIQSNQRYYLLALKTEEGPWMIQGWESVNDALRYFQDTYNGAHRRGYEASMSACLNWMSFRPSVVTLPLVALERLIAELKVVRISNIAGWITGIPLKPDLGAQAFADGVQPQLITE